MNQKSRVTTWVCLTVLMAAGLKYLPSYLLEQRKLDLEDRVLDLREQAFLHQRVAPTVSVPAPIQPIHTQWL